MTLRWLRAVNSSPKPFDPTRILRQIEQMTRPARNFLRQVCSSLGKGGDIGRNLPMLPDHFTKACGNSEMRDE